MQLQASHGRICIKLNSSVRKILQIGSHGIVQEYAKCALNQRRQEPDTHNVMNREWCVRWFDGISICVVPTFKINFAISVWIEYLDNSLHQRVLLQFGQWHELFDRQRSRIVDIEFSEATRQPSYFITVDCVRKAAMDQEPGPLLEITWEVHDLLRFNASDWGRSECISRSSVREFVLVGGVEEVTYNWWSYLLVRMLRCPGRELNRELRMTLDHQDGTRRRTGNYSIIQARVNTIVHEE